ncbi:MULTISPECIES: hypothetical protein [unclassified Frankia]|uniref:hypothetical protein n=1 Tax=unclassified Frankia TaxID=2632575 RepID=UPI001EF4B0F2|nr:MULTISPECIES: hypothetical protein [unclassified Frankia]
MSSTFPSGYIGVYGHGAALAGVADRGSAGTSTIKAIAVTGADLLIRVTGNRRLPVLRTLPDGSWISRIGPVEFRVIRWEVTVTTTRDHGGRLGRHLAIFPRLSLL